MGHDQSPMRRKKDSAYGAPGGVAGSGFGAEFEMENVTVGPFSVESSFSGRTWVILTPAALHCTSLQLE